MEENERIILQDYEYLLGARGAAARGDAESVNSFLTDIRADVTSEYNDGVDKKIERWIDVTRVAMWRQSRSVEIYVQAKMLYRDGFFEAAVMVARSVCELVCYELLQTVPHSFGSSEDIERQNFRRLSRHLSDSAAISARTYDLLNQLYDLANNYVHPKSAQSPRDDARNAMLMLGEALWGIYGATSDDLCAGAKLQSAYLGFPEICTAYQFPIEFFATPEAALRDARRWGRMP